MIGKFVSKCCDDIPVTSLAQAYVPFQKICGYFEPREALKEGTIFPSLTGLYNYNKEW